jgi:type II secretory pathway component GspD/PulD (secretin)
MVGYHTPIFKTDVSNSSTTSGAAASTITQTLDYYQEIGIKLFVVPQVNEEGYINMIVHPSVTSSERNLNAEIVATGVDPVSTPYPVIDVRETQTQVLLRDGETIVIGGLLKDQSGKETQGIPFLENIPFLGGVFRRDTYAKRKIDLLIFINARVIKEGEYTEEEITKLKDNLGKEANEIAAADKRKKKKKVSVKIDNATPSSK